MSAPEHEDAAVVEDLAMLVRRLVSALERSRGQTSLTRQARDYLARKGLEGHALRSGNDLGEMR